MDGLLPFILLAGSLLVFLLSTGQLPWIWRALIWLVGLSLLGASALAALTGATSVGALQALADLVFRQQGGDVLATAIEGNFATVGAAIAPMFGVFFVLALAIAAVSLIAFTPGEAVEKIIRPMNTALLGAIAGGLIALLVAGLGVGGLEKRHVFLNVVEDGDVIDGDTIRMGDVSLRLWGIDASESNTGQMCRHNDSGRSLYGCGEEAKKVLEALAKDKFVICEAPKPSAGATQTAGKAPGETFGRPVMSCWIAAAGDRLYLSAEMARQGYADAAFFDNLVDPSRDEILTALAEAKSKKAGIWNGWTIPPDDWRNNQACRSWFVAPEWTPPEGSNAVARCPDFAPLPANDNTPPNAASPDKPAVPANPPAAAKPAPAKPGPAKPSPPKSAPLAKP